MRKPLLVMKHNDYLYGVHRLTTRACVCVFCTSSSQVTMWHNGWFFSSLHVNHPFSPRSERNKLETHNNPNLLPGTLVFSMRKSKKIFSPSFIKNLRIRFKNCKNTSRNTRLASVRNSLWMILILIQEVNQNATGRRQRCRERWIQISYHNMTHSGTWFDDVHDEASWISLLLYSLACFVLLLVSTVSHSCTKNA